MVAPPRHRCGLVVLMRAVALTRTLLVAAFAGVPAAPAAAQTVYVTGSAGVDLARFNRISSNVPLIDASDESASFAVRLGAGLRRRWGVEVELMRPVPIRVSAIQDSPLVPPVPGAPRSPSGVIGGVALVGPLPQFDVRVERRTVSTSVVGWVQHETGRDLLLRYLGGVAFHRIDHTTTVNLLPPTRIIAGSLDLGSRSTVFENVGPVAGVEAHWGLAEHLRLIPGVRVHALREGLIIRPSVGLGWSF